MSTNSHNDPVNFVDPDGAKTTMYVHSAGSYIGHVAININGTVYSYGRYYVSDANPTRVHGTIGGGVLIMKPENEYLADYSIKDNISKYSIKYSAKQEAEMASRYMTAYNSGIPLTGEAEGKGMLINEYNLISQNCATTMIDFLPSRVLKSNLISTFW